MLKRSLFYLIGLTIISFGVSLTIKADVGVGAWDALNVGLSETVGLTVGSWVFIVGCILIVINALLMKKKPDLPALITIIMLGSLIDFWLLIALKPVVLQGLFIRYVIFFIAIVVIAMGVAIYLQAKFAPVPIDDLMITLRHRLNLNITMAKTMNELLALVAAFLLSGPIGVGTLIITFSIGPIIQFFFPFFEKLYTANAEVGKSH
ncbi:membrane protein [Bacillus sp. HMF5848]|uniref:YczE/YyaS/YitT family protein n=1 Tax=Bacillus sp. HMF5848 TaxID=2495421 RepID=UPI000F79EDB1|nr:membrane protein [Bacillus sp. HMF5848]RSK26070.1 membrane protein [Bacillus sp. HMF5848]